MKCACQICNGGRGGVPGNENVIQGIVICDYCTADHLKFQHLVEQKRASIADELHGILADIEGGQPFDAVCLATLKRCINELEGMAHAN